jgi:hypothetical protein
MAIALKRITRRTRVPRLDGENIADTDDSEWTPIRLPRSGVYGAALGRPLRYPVKQPLPIKSSRTSSPTPVLFRSAQRPQPDAHSHNNELPTLSNSTYELAKPMRIGHMWRYPPLATRSPALRIAGTSVESAFPLPIPETWRHGSVRIRRAA